MQLKLFEEWASVIGFEGLYEVSSNGRIRSISRCDRLGRFYKGKLLKPQNLKGYRKVIITGNGLKAQRLIHRLVYESFVSVIPNHLEIDHINGIKSDNRLLNLRLVTRSTNNKSFRTTSKFSSSKYRGVTKNFNKWNVKIFAEGKPMYLGSYDDEIEAAKVFDRAALRFGFNKEALNFIP